MKHLWIVLAACLFVLGGPETLAWARPVASSAAKATSPSKQTKSSKSKRTASRGDEEGVDGPPPPPASNEIPPPPPPLKLNRKKRRKTRSRSSRRYRYKRGGADWKSKQERYEDMRRWEERYGDREYRRRKRRRRVRRQKRRSRSWYRRYRHKRYLRRKRNRARFWWSSESGLYLFSYSPSASSSSTYDYLGLIAGGRIGVTYKSFVMSFGAAMAFSLSDNGGGDDFANVGGYMGRLSVSMGWLLGRYLLMEGGLSMEYLGLNRGSLETSALLFPVHVGLTIRFPMGRLRRNAVGLQALLSFAHDPNTEGTYFSTTINLVFQTF